MTRVAVESSLGIRQVRSNLHKHTVTPDEFLGRIRAGGYLSAVRQSLEMRGTLIQAYRMQLAGNWIFVVSREELENSE